jgi:hypothetical protein
LSYLHDKQIIHRDMAARNLYVSKSNISKKISKMNQKKKKTNRISDK